MQQVAIVGTMTVIEVVVTNLFHCQNVKVVHHLSNEWGVTCKYTTPTIVLWPFVRDYPGEPVPEETFTHPPSWSSSNLHQLLPSTMIHSIASSLFKLRAWQFFCTTSPGPLWSTFWSGAKLRAHIPYIYSPNHCLLFVAHAHTCFAVVPRLYNLFLVFLSTPYLELSIFYHNIIHPPDHSHLSSLKCHLIFFLTGQVSLLCNILLRIQLLYGLPVLINDISLLLSNGTISDSGLNSCISISLSVVTVSETDTET